MRVALGADHAGFELKELLVETLRDRGHVPVDVGTHDRNPVDYPDIAVRVAREMATGDTPRGILICGSGVGVSMAANRLAGIRAGLCHYVDCGTSGGVPVPVLSAALYARFSSQGEAEFADKLLSAMRFEFGGHAEKESGS